MDSEQRQAFLAARRRGIGASDVAAVCGLSKFRTPLHVYLDKLGLLPDDDTPSKRWGRLLEEVVAQAYAEETGREVRPVEGLVVRHPTLDWVAASPDRDVVDHPLYLECKTARTPEGWGEPGTDEVPNDYHLQCQWQILAAEGRGIEGVDVAVLIGGSDFRRYHVPRCPEIQHRLLEIAGELWDRIQRRDPPPADWNHPDTNRLVRLLSRPREEVRADLGSFALADVWRYQELGHTISEAEKEREQVKTRLILALGQAGAADLPGGMELVRRVTEIPEAVVTRKAHLRDEIRIRKKKERP